MLILIFSEISEGKEQLHESQKETLGCPGIIG